MGDKGGAAATLHDIGRVYADLGDSRQALHYFEQSLPLRKQVWKRWGEAAERFHIALAAEALGDLARAEAELQIVVAIDAATSHPDLEDACQALERIRQKMRSGV